MATLATAGLAGRDLSIVDLDEVRARCAKTWGADIVAAPGEVKCAAQEA